MVKADVVHDVYVHNNIFYGMPMCECGEKSFNKGTKIYNNTFMHKKPLGSDTFTDLVDILTNKGKSKVGISMYCFKSNMELFTIFYNSNIFSFIRNEYFPLTSLS